MSGIIGFGLIQLYHVKGVSCCFSVRFYMNFSRIKPILLMGKLCYITFIIGVNKVKADTVDSIGKLSYGLPRRS
jgi:hypothetical protein